MSLLLAAIDDSAAARPVLEVARRLAELLGAQLEAVHVQEDGSGQSASGIAEAAGVPLRVRSGIAVAELVSEVVERRAVGLVIGARGLPAGASPAGHVALDLVRMLDQPIVIVPPDANDRPMRRVLVAIEGNGESRALRALVDRVGDRETPEVIAVHVTELRDLPMFADNPAFEADAFEREFMMRAASTVVADPSHLRLEMRVGDAPDELRHAARDLDADLVVMAWHRDLSEGHGRLVREMLAALSVPLALFPIDA